MNNKIKKMAIITLLSVMVVILQLLATYINFGTFSITLTLIPIIVAGAIYGVEIGSLMGFVFGATVSAIVIISPDPSSALMFSTHPIITILTCVIKGVLAGFIPALVYKVLSKKINKTLSLVISAALAPIINTLTFCLSLYLFFDESLKTLIGIVVSVNFLIEFILNVALAPGLNGLVSHWQKRTNSL